MRKVVMNRLDPVACVYLDWLGYPYGVAVVLGYGFAAKQWHGII
jgi:hypothetical protein